MSGGDSGGVALVRPSRVRSIVLLAVSLGFVAAGIALLPISPTLGWCAIGPFGLCAALSALNLMPGASQRRLAADGVEVRTLFRSHRVAWRDIARFGAAQVGLRTIVGWDFAAGHGGHGRMRETNLQLSGFEAALPDTDGRTAAALAQDMESRRLAARPHGETRESAR